MEEQFYVLIKIFTYLEYKDLHNIKLLNKLFSRIILNRCNSDDNEKYGNISNDFYLTRLKLWFNSKIVDFQPENMSSMEYHKICNLHYNIPHNISYTHTLCSKNKLLQLQMLEIFQIYPTIDNLNQACKYGNLEIIQYFAPDILPDTLGANAAYYNNHDDIVEFLKKYGIIPLINTLFVTGNTNTVTGGTGLYNFIGGGLNNGTVTIGANSTHIGNNFGVITTGSYNTLIGDGSGTILGRAYNTLFRYNLIFIKS